MKAQAFNKFFINTALIAGVVFCFAFLCFSLALGQTQEPSAFLYLSPSSGSFLVGSVFTVSVFVDTGGAEINSIFVELDFSKDKLQVASPTAGSSFISEWIIPPNYSNGKGRINFQGGVSGDMSASAGLVSSITFRAMAPGIAKIETGKDSKVLLNNGEGRDILSYVRGGEYNILIPPPEGPAVFSPTHSNPNVWYPDSVPSFIWDKESGTTDFSWEFNQNPNSRPDAVSEGDKTAISFPRTKDGIWYFHLRQKKAGIWGGTSHYAVRVDISKPKEFEVKAEKDSASGKIAVLYFDADDISSGIDHYEVSIIGLDDFETASPFFTEQASPYKIPFEEQGRFKAIVRAFDKAGNFRQAETEINLGLVFFTFPIFWFIFILLAMIIVMTIIIIRLLKKRKQ